MKQNLVIKVLLSLLFLLFGFFLPFVSPTNLCSTSGLCCKNRDSECVAQRVYPNHTVDTSQLPCYCDHACIELEDCCPDYKQFCGVKDCHVSEWGPWSPCSAEKCEEFGVEERHRVVLHHPVNGGLKCPHLLQSKQCQTLPCETQPKGSNNIENWRHQEEHQEQESGQQTTFNNKGDENVLQSQQKKQQKQSNHQESKEEDQELSKQQFTKHYNNNNQHYPNKKKEHMRAGFWRVSSLYTDKSREQQYIAENESEEHDSSSHKHKVLAVKKREDKRQKSDVDKSVDGGDGGCMEMVIIRASSGCHIHDKRLHLGTRICVECSTNPPHHNQLGSHNRYKKNHFNHISATRTRRSTADKSCSAALTEMPIRKFRINQTCHGKLTFLSRTMSTKCNCRKGLHYELV